MKFLLSRLAGTAIVALAACGFVLAPAGSGSAAPATFCSEASSYPGTTITWTGQASKAHSHDWNDPDNWSPATVPDADQTTATYQTQFVCIGDDNDGHPASVTIAGVDSFHVAGIDVGEGAQLALNPGARLFMGATDSTAVVPSVVEKHSALQLEAATIGGNSPLTVSGTLRWEGKRSGIHKEVATQTSSECVYDPSLATCPGDTSPGGGRTVIAAGATMLVEGKKFGGVILGDQRVIDNAGTIKIAQAGYIAMNDGTSLVDEPGSSLDLEGLGGIHRGIKETTGTAPTLLQRGVVLKDGSGTSVVGVPVSFATKGKPHVTVSRGGLDLSASKLPIAKVGRESAYGLGGCHEPINAVCHHAEPTSGVPQVATVTTSAEAPKVSKIAVALAGGHRKLHGHAVLGHAVNVTAPTIKTSHSTHITLSYDTTIRGSTTSAKATVYRGKHRISLCKVHRLTATNPSCVFSSSVAHGGGASTKGDLTIVIITIKPNARWLVT